MFLQNILQQRLQSLNDEELYLQAQQASKMTNTSELPKIATVGGPSTHNPSNFTRAKKPIGSINNGQITFAKDQTFFTGSEDEKINMHVTQKTDAIKELIDKDILATKRREWVNSNATIGHPTDPHHSKNLFDIKTGLTDEAIQSMKSQKVYAGTDTRDAHHSGWNVSNELVHHRDSERFLQATRGPMMDKTRTAGERILGQKQYINPEALSSMISESVRNQKEDDVDMREDLTIKVKYEKPRASEQQVNAIVTRQIYEKTMVRAAPDDPELTLKPDMKKTLKSEKIKVREHNGKYEVQKFCDKGKEAWSCCQCRDKEAEGCVVKVVDKKKWILSSYTS